MRLHRDVGKSRKVPKSHLAEKFLHFAHSDVQSKNDVVIGAVEMLEGFFIVVCGDAVFRKVKGV